MRSLPAALLTTVLVVGGCGGEQAGPQPVEPAPSSSPSSSPSGTTPRATPTSTPTPVVPVVPARRPGQLAGQVRAAQQVLRTAAPDSASFRAAAEFRQLAARALGVRGPAHTAAVLERLGPADRRVLRPEGRAAGLLNALTDAQPRLPRWRIVAPPPAEALLRHYRAAEREIGVPWEYLAAIHLVETRMGRIRGTSTAGAEGPMQFLPSTFAQYGAGGDIEDTRDAIFAAARLLRANGAPGDLAGALWSYNHHRNYVGAVTAYARAIERDPRTYRVYWHWRVLYKHRSGPQVLPEGYPRVRPVPVS